MEFSSFNLDQQNQNIDHRIVGALERISVAFRTLLWNEGKENALSPTQIQVLIFIRFHPVEMSRVSHLATELNMTKATISDSVKTLLVKGLLEKEADAADQRRHHLLLTPKGREVADKAAGFASAIVQPVQNFSEEQKAAMLSGLLQLIYELNKSGVITVQRMCFTCVNYEHRNGEHFCHLLKSPITDNHLRVDCPEHEMRVVK